MRSLLVAGAVIAAVIPHPMSAQQQNGLGVASPTFFAVQTGDVTEAEEWYSRVFGLPVVRSIDNPERGFRIRILSDSTLHIELIQAESAEPPPTQHLGLFKAGLFVHDIDAAHRWLRAQGVSTDERVFTDETLQLRSFVFTDLEGNRLQAFQRCADTCS